MGPLDQLQGDIQKDEVLYGRRQGDLAARQEQISADREKTLGPMEQKISQDIAQPLPERLKTQLPEFKAQPLIPAKDYETLSYGLIAMAMIGGMASKGKWLDVGSSLNGALDGYLKGNQEVAQKKYDDYQREFQSAKAKEDQANKEFEAILKNKQLRISDQIQQYRLVAAKYDRQDAMVASQSRSLDAMWRSLESRKTALARLEEQHNHATQMLDLQREKNKPAEPTLSPEAITQAAKRYHETRVLPTNIGRGNQGAANIKAILDAEAKMGEGSSSADIKANQSSLANITKMLDSVQSFENTALKNLDMLVAQSEKVFRLGIPFLDKQIMAGTKAITGDPELVKFYAIVKPFVDEYAKILEGKTGAAGSTVSGREQAAELLQPYFTKEGIRQLAPFMKQEMRNRSSSLEEQRKAIMDRMGGKESAPASGGLPAGWSVEVH